MEIYINNVRWNIIQSSIGDFWHIEETIPDFYDSNGNSLFLIHTNRGEELFEKISELDWSKITEEKATQGMKFDITI